MIVYDLLVHLSLSAIKFLKVTEIMPFKSLESSL